MTTLTNHAPGGGGRPVPLGWPALPGGIAACLMPILRSDATSAFTGEMRAVAHAVPRRRAEFVAGRACARTALAALGVAPQAIAVAADRTPCWPAGYVGSISHSPSYAIALAADAERFASLGVDMEPALPLPSNLEPLIVHPQDRPCDNADGLAAKRMFVAKEAYYKALYPLRRDVLDFMDVTIELTCTRGTAFRAVRRSDGSDEMTGTITTMAGHLVAVVAPPVSIGLNA